MPRKVGESHSVAYLTPSSAKALDVDEGFYIIEDDVTENSVHTDSDGNEYTARHETNPTPVRRVFPAPDGEDGWVYGEDDEGGED